MRYRRLREFFSPSSLSEGLDIYAKVGTGALGTFAIIYFTQQAWGCCRDIYCNDVMEITGSLTCLIGVLLSFGLRQRFRGLIGDLVRSGAIKSHIGIEDFENAITRSVGRYCLFTMLLLTAAEIIAYELAGHTGSHRDWIECMLSAAAASIVGERFGRLAAYARAGNLITSAGGAVSINFWHPDNAGGLLAFSRFYFYSALLAAIPAVWLGIWWVIIPRVAYAVPQWDYSEWRGALVVLWLVIVSVGIWSFVMPIYTIHRLMEAAKEQFMAPLGWIPPALTDLHAQLQPIALDDQAQPILARIEGIEKVYRNASAVNTWPLDPSLAGALTGLGAVQLLVPIGLRLILGEDPAYQDALIELLHRLK